MKTSTVIKSWLVALLLTATTGAQALDNINAIEAHQEHSDLHGDDDDAALREIAAQRVHWLRAGPIANPESWLHVKILGINDFHGQLSTGRRVGNRPVGGAAILASYLHAAQQGINDRAVIVHAGDHVGASPPASALLQDEPSISFLNLLGNDYCRIDDTLDPRCNLVGTLGNHEFDEGMSELQRLLGGGNHPTDPFLENPYRGATFPYVSANVVDAQSGKPILPPYVIKKVRGMSVAFIGAVLKETPTIVTPTGVAGLRFLDEADSINRYIPELRTQKVRAIVVLIHQGGSQRTYQGFTQNNGVVSGEIVKIVSRLDDEVDVVMSGHAHSFTNAILKNNGGKDILVTQAFSAGTAYADIDVEIDPATKDIVKKSAQIVTTYGDAGPGLTPDTQVAELVAQAEQTVAPLVNRVVGTAQANITRTQTSAGESALGNLIADSQRAAMNTDFAFMNPGGIRADLDAGPVTWGELFTIQPFGNSLVKMELTGQQIYDLLNQQWLNQPFPRILQVSGLTYTWDNARPVGSRVVEIRKNGAPISLAQYYSVTANSFIAAGGDNFTVFNQGVNRVGGPLDLDALIAYIGALPQPFSAMLEGRIARIN
jgi:5'-nucleotidase